MLHPDPANEPVELQTAIGRMVMAWAYIEAAIDGICLSLFHKFDPLKITESELPRAFSRKAAYIKKCVKKLTVLQPLDKLLMPAIEETIKLSETRHFIAHGFVLEYEIAFDGQQFVHRKMNYGTEAHSLGSKSFTIKDIYNVSGKCLEMAAILANFGQGLLLLSQTLGDQS